jgi:hypothetical protein
MRNSGFLRSFASEARTKSQCVIPAFAHSSISSLVTSWGYLAIYFSMTAFTTHLPLAASPLRAGCRHHP